MAEVTLIESGLAALLLLAGIGGGWLARARRCGREKQAISDGWREQIAAQKSEHHRLADQNKSLMEQVSQYQASRRDSENRARELSASLREAFERRDELQRQVRDLKLDLDRAVVEQERLREAAGDPVQGKALLEAKDEKIEKLTRELQNWQDRLPPLIERFRTRDLEARELELELARANERIAGLERPAPPDRTHVEQVDTSSLGAFDASNEQYEDTAQHDARLLNGSGEPAAAAGDDGDHDGEDANDQAAAAGHADGANADDEDADRDDLKMIKGVGPAIEKTLNELGIYRFGQIATLSESEIDRVAGRLKGFRSRIYREDWIGQARLLQVEKEAETV